MSGNLAPERVRALVKLLEERCEQAGRDAATIRRSIQLHWDGEDLPRLREESVLYRSLGFSEQVVIFALDRSFTADDIDSATKRLAEFLPELRRAGD